METQISKSMVGSLFNSVPVIFAALIFWSVSVEAGIVFRETFDYAGGKPLGCTEFCSIIEGRSVGGRMEKRLAFRPEDDKAASVYPEFLVLPERARVSDYEFEFRFTFPHGSEKAFTLSLVSGDPAEGKKLTTSVITISEKAVGIRPATSGLLPPFVSSGQDLVGRGARDFDILPMLERFTYGALVRARGRTIELFVENDGRMIKLAQAETTGSPLAGFNFGGSTAVDFSGVEIRRIAPLGDGDFRDENGMSIANNAAEYRMDVPENTTAISADVRIGTYPGAMIMKIGYADETERIIDVKSFAIKYDKDVLRQVNELGPDGKLVSVIKPVKEDIILPDAGLNFMERGGKWRLTYNTRPLISGLSGRYVPEDAVRIVSNWERYPAATEKFVRFELRPDGEGAQLWLDGRYAGRFEGESKINLLSFILPAGGSVRDAKTSSNPFDNKFLMLDVDKIANPGSFADAQPSLIGEQTIDGVPLFVVAGQNSADIGVCRDSKGMWRLETDAYLGRTAFDGMPESLIFSVPVEQYIRAWTVCAVEEDPDKVPVITARLTRFDGMGGQRGPAIADTTVTLPRTGEPLPEGVRKIGEIKTGGRTLPLYLVEIPIDAGSIQDVLFQEHASDGTPLACGRRPLAMGAYLDFEILGKLNEWDNFYRNNERKPCRDELSSVHVFAATLERSPVEALFMPVRVSNVYQPGEKAGMEVTLRAVAKTDCKLEWIIADHEGGNVGQGAREFSFAGPGAEEKITLPLDQKEIGWYSVEYKLSEKNGRPILGHSAYFAQIDKDTREAGYESPYLTWWPWAHGMHTDRKILEEIFSRAGIRKIGPTRRNTPQSEADALPFKFTKGQFTWIGTRRHQKSPEPEEQKKHLIEVIKDKVERWPHTEQALIFWESARGPFPLELLDERTEAETEAERAERDRQLLEQGVMGGLMEISGEQAERDKRLVEQGVAVAKAWRKAAPHIKLVVGNTQDSIRIMASLFRGGYPKEYIDAIGEESVGMSMPPERNTALNNWMLRELGRLHGYGDLPIEACMEWKSRPARMLGGVRAAEWRMRDALIALAWGCRTINIMEWGNEPANSYYNTVWSGASFTRNPQFYPYPIYPAIAAHTLVLDCAEFTRMIPTGSLTVYALEFKRDNEYIYAFWTARGELEMTLEFEQDAAIRMTGTYGRLSDLKTGKGGLDIRVGEGPVYLTSPVSLQSVASLGKRVFPREQPPADATIMVADKMDNLENWTLDTSVDPRIDVPAKAPVTDTSFRKPGDFELRRVEDEEKGWCLELELVHEGTCPALMQEYAFLRLAEFAEFSGTPHTVGVWVKGNSSWGKIFWEFEDAGGEKWMSAGSGGYGCTSYDWPEQAGINFDGWHFMQFPITSRSQVKVPSPGENDQQWVHDGTGNRRIDYPIRLTGIAVSMPRRTLNILEMEPVETTIRLHGLSAY